MLLIRQALTETEPFAWKSELAGRLPGAGPLGRASTGLSRL
ncbi:MAG TPA: hypothetical protein VFX25_35360 [Streptosporangiaceae bacterium]|nr:hypothetical protein [Streptosporangiaceae bacterium]